VKGVERNVEGKGRMGRWGRVKGREEVEGEKVQGKGREGLN